MQQAERSANVTTQPITEARDFHRPFHALHQLSALKVVIIIANQHATDTSTKTMYKLQVKQDHVDAASLLLAA
jgi:hypothetical protein